MRILERWLERLAPENPHAQYAHNQGEDNADAHLKRSVMGRETVVALTAGRLDFGPWEQLFYGEFDGRRKKRGAGQDHRRIGRGRGGAPWRANTSSICRG